MKICRIPVVIYPVVGITAIYSLTATCRIGKSWDLGFKWRYVAGGPYTPYDRETSARIEAWEAKHQPYYDYSRFNTQRLPAFHQLDVRVDKSFSFESGR